MRSPGNDGLTFGATVKADKEAGKFPIKDKDTALAAAFAFLREKVLQRLSFSDCSSYAFPPFANSHSFLYMYHLLHVYHPTLAVLCLSPQGAFPEDGDDSDDDECCFGDDAFDEFE